MAVTDEQIAEALVAEITRLGGGDGDLVPLGRVERRVPGDWYRQGAVELRLHAEGVIDLVQVRGRPYVCLGGEMERELAAKAKAERRTRWTTHVA